MPELTLYSKFKEEHFFNECAQISAVLSQPCTVYINLDIHSIHRGS